MKSNYFVALSQLCLFAYFFSFAFQILSKYKVDNYTVSYGVTPQKCRKKTKNEEKSLLLFYIFKYKY